MIEEAQRIAIAEACGWTDIHQPSDKWRPLRGRDSNGKLGVVPDFLHDLNAMHEAEKLLEKRNRDFEYDLMERYYRTELQTVVGGVLGCPAQISATAAQRAEAFLRVIGKWTET